jgi:hypothetical protein
MMVCSDGSVTFGPFRCRHVILRFLGQCRRKEDLADQTNEGLKIDRSPPQLSINIQNIRPIQLICSDNNYIELIDISKFCQASINTTCPSPKSPFWIPSDVPNIERSKSLHASQPVCDDIALSLAR